MRPIDADAYEEHLRQVGIKYTNEYGGHTAVKILHEEETLEVSQVRHGQWENYPSHTYRRCSLCKMEWAKPQLNIRANYCPNCGAKMDLGEKHG